MEITSQTQNPRQKFYLDMVLGFLVYIVVLGFFEEYTAILSTWSYSITFLVAVVMQILTYFFFWLKGLVVKYFKGKDSRGAKTAMIFGVWLIMFSSKFVFLAAINHLFDGKAVISGFWGLILIIITMLLVKLLFVRLYKRLA